MATAGSGCSVKCRDVVIGRLQDTLSRTEPCMPVVLTGNSGTGKSYCLKYVLRKLNCLFVNVNCVECFTPRLLYHFVLKELKKCLDTEDFDFYKVEGVRDFFFALREILEGCELAVYLCLFKAERLREMPANILRILLRIGELSQSNISCILITDIPWQNFGPITAQTDAICIHFSEYTKDEKLFLLKEDSPQDYKALYSVFCDFVYGIFATACRSLPELRHVVRTHWPSYISPVRDGDCRETDCRRLCLAIEPTLRAALNTVYLREIHTTDQSDPKRRNHLELPFYSKYLLIAAYLASYNPANSDKRFFVKASAKIKKKANPKMNKRKSAQLLGPKPFPLERLMAVFYAIIDDEVVPSFNLYTQISSLCTLGLLMQINSSDLLDTPKYKCIVTLDIVRLMARTVAFDVTRYLYDFVT